MRRKLLTYFMCFVVGFFLLKILMPKPPLCDDMSFSRAIYDREGKLLRLTLSADDKYRVWMPFTDFSDKLVEATLLREDRYFYWHSGVNPVSLVRAAFTTFVKKRRIGASTITMQVARLRSGMNSRTIGGKIKQILRALHIELKHNKNDILEAYLNLVPYGGNIEGASAASLIHFSKSARDLTLSEALTLAIIPQSPSKRNLYKNSKNNGLNPDFRIARKHLLVEWIKNNQDDLREGSVIELPMEIKGTNSLPFIAPHFTDSVIMEDIYFTKQIHTTIDCKLQKLLERIITNYIEAKRDIGIENAAAMLIDHRSMELLAAVGSADYFNDSISGQVNGYRAKRSPGSALKPMVYALGMDQGLIHPMTMLKDAPSVYGGFSPENFDGEFEGPIKVRDALIRSRNIPALHIASKLKEPDFYSFLKESGIVMPHDASYYGLAPVLGGAEVTMMDLVKLYAMLANGGRLQSIQYRNDIEQNEEKRMLSPESCFLILDILKDLPRPNQGYSKKWMRDNMPVYWKTGTSYAFRDAWSVGIFGQYVLAVWIGDFSGEGNPSYVGIKAAAPLFFNILDGLRSHDLEYFGPYLPSSLSKVKVCSVSGCLPGPHCPNNINTWYIPGKSPIKKCSIHRLVLVDADTGKIVSPDKADKAEAKVYEFWPSDLLKIFQRAGIPRRIPPSESSDLVVHRLGYIPASALQITSPVAELTYNIRVNTDKDQCIPLTAITDADAREVYWFADSQFLARSERGKVVLWKPKLGRSVIRVVDDRGRSDACYVKVAAIE